MALSAGLTATYVDASTFKLFGETDQNGVPYTDIFHAGRRTRADCGGDGIVFSEATSASYDSGADETTVSLDDAVLTSNLTTIWFGVSSEDALPKHPHTGDASGGQISHGSLLDIGPDDHHARYTDSEAISAINGDPDHGSSAPHDALTADTVDLSSEYDNGSVSSDTTIDWSQGNVQVITLAADITLSFSNMGVGHKQLRVVQDSTGGRTPTLPSGKWPGGSAGSFSTGAGAVDILSIFYDGSSYYYMLSKGWA